MNSCLVIVPTYNESENIAALISKVLFLPVNFDVLIVDDGSPDGTARIVKQLQKYYPDRIFLKERSGKLGLGTAYIFGFQFAVDKGYEYVFEMDADFSHNPEDLVKLYRSCLEDGYDLTIGSRYIKGVNVVNWPMNRVLMSYFASSYVGLVTGMPIKDTTAGFKCYHRSVLETILLENIRFVGYAFQIEMKFTAWMYGFKIKEVPIIFTDRAKGVSKMSMRIFWEAMFGVIRMKINSLFKKYHRKTTELVESDSPDRLYA